MMKKLCLLIIILNFSSPVFGGVENNTPSFSLEEETLEILYKTKNDSKPHATATCSIRKNSQPEKTYYQLIQNGKGNYDQFKDVQWTMTSHMMEDYSSLLILESTTHIYDKFQVQLAQFKKVYNYQKKEITFQKLNGRGNVLKEKIFPIKGPTCDDVTLVHFLRAFVANQHKERYQKFYLLTNEPKLYQVIIKNRGKEILNLPIGRINAMKIQLMADLGPLTEIVAQFVPPTFVWYTDHYPYDWLQYEGLESGFGSANIQAYVLKRK